MKYCDCGRTKDALTSFFILLLLLLLLGFRALSLNELSFFNFVHAVIVVPLLRSDNTFSSPSSSS